MALLTLFVGGLASAEGDGWSNRQNVIRAAMRMAEAVEVFDGHLHAVDAPTALIGAAHHLEETVLIYVSDLEEMPYKAAVAELNHIRQDMELIRREMFRVPKLLGNRRILFSFLDMHEQSRRVHLEIYRQVPAGPGPGPGPGGLKLNGAEYSILGQGALQSTPASVAGTGAIIFRNPLKQDDNNFDLSFALDNGGSLKLVTNANPNLKGGAEMSFRRDGKTLKVMLMNDDLSEEFTEVAADEPLKISVDIHEHGHVIVWVGAGEEQEYTLSAQLSGQRWGLALAGATVTGAKDGPAKDDHGGHDH